MKQSGYSLLEMLVVMAIVAVLAGLIFPILRSSVTRTKAQVSLENTHQLGLAMHLYREDIGEYPIAGSRYNQLAAYGINQKSYEVSPVSSTGLKFTYDMVGRGIDLKYDRSLRECQNSRMGSMVLVTDGALLAKIEYRSIGTDMLILTREDLSGHFIRDVTSKLKANLVSKPTSPCTDTDPLWSL